MISIINDFIELLNIDLIIIPYKYTCQKPNSMKKYIKEKLIELYRIVILKE